MVRTLSIVSIIILLCSLMSGCYDRREVDDEAYVIAIGLDKGKKNTLKMTLQIAVPTTFTGGGETGAGGSGGQDQKSSTITTVETPAIFAGINIVNTYVSKEINLSHTKVFVFSSELAKEGIHEYIHAIMRSREFKPNMYILVSRGSAENYIKNVRPFLEVNPAKYYEMNLSAYEYTGFTADSRFINFYLQEECTCSQAVAVLAGVSQYKSSEEFEVEAPTLEQKGRFVLPEGDFKAGGIPKVGEVKAEIMGLAVFDGDKMVGELDGEETIYYLMISGHYNRSYLSFPDPEAREAFIILNVKQARKPVNKVEMVDDRPHISTSVKLEADILSIQSGKNYEEGEKLKTLERVIGQFIEQEMRRFLYRTSKELHSDICMFGKDMKWKLLTWKEWQEFQWLERYEDAVFEVDVDVKIRRPGLMLRSTPAYSTKGKEMR